MLSREQRIGVFFVIGLVLLFLTIELTLGVGLFEHRYPLYAVFTDVQGLDSGADVRLAGIKAGRVESMRLEQGRVVVKMAIDAGLVVKKDSVARPAFRAITGKLDKGTGTLGLMLNDPTLYERVTATMSDVRESAHDLGTVANDIAAGKGTLGKLLTEDGGLYEQVRQTVDNLSASARNAEE